MKTEAVRYVDVGTAELAYRRIGSGPPLVMIHGWPLSGLTWRYVVPRLAERFTCYAVDSPGAGETRWRAGHDFSFGGQAKTYRRFLDALDLGTVSVIAHDTGATIARELAILVGKRIDKLVLINTEIPDHRPPYIELYQKLPVPLAVFRALLANRRFRHSAAGFGGCFCDPNLLDGEFHELFIAPLLASGERLDGQVRYLRGIDWKLVDSLFERHRQIAAKVLLVWGEDDRTFPITRAIEMVTQLEHCVGLRAVRDAKLLAHEERPDAVVDYALELLG